MQFSDLRGALLDALGNGLDARWSPTADLLRSAFDADHCCITFHHRRGSFETVMAGSTPPWADRYEKRFASINPFLGEVLRRFDAGERTIVSSADAVLPLAHVRETAYYDEFYRPLGLNDSVGILVCDTEGPAAHVSMRRASSRLRYGVEDEARMRAVSGVIVDAVRRTRALRALRVRAEVGEQLAADLGVACVLFDSRGHAVGEVGGGGEIARAHPRDVERLLRGTEAVPGGGAVGSWHATLHRTSLGTRPFALAVFRKHSEDRDSLVPAPRFTRRERDALALLLRGLDNPTIARNLGIGLYTAKDHVKAIYRKLGVHTRAEAIARAAASGIP